MTKRFQRVAVLGSGVMGSAVAAHFANAGVPALVLDIVPTDLTEEERAAGLSPDDRAARNRIADRNVRALAKARPSPLFSAGRMELIETGNLEDDLPRLAEADWIIEAVKEDLKIKHGLFAKVVPKHELSFMADHKEYETLIEQFIEDFEPTSQIACTLIESLAFGTDDSEEFSLGFRVGVRVIEEDLGERSDRGQGRPEIMGYFG